MTRLARLRVLLITVLALVACDSSGDPGPTSSSTTTTTIENDTCDRVAADTATYLEDLIDALDETRLDELLDPSGWGQELRDLQRAGKDLDLRVGALRCDAAEIQRRAFAEADLVPNGPLSSELVELLLTPSTTTTTVPDETPTTSVEESTTSTGATTTDG